jgi:hypothetical protein
MAFDPIDTSEITAGEPVSTLTQTKIKDNFDDHEERLQTAEGSVAVYPPIIFRVNGRYGLAGEIEGLLKTTANFSLTITGVRILIDVAGSAGTTEIDLLRKRGGDPFESILSSRPQIDYTEGDDALSDNAVLDLTKVDILAGDILRLDLTSVQTDGKGFLVRVDYNRG